MQNMTITKRASQLRGGRDREREMTYHHLSSEELWDCSLNTSAFHFVLYVVQELHRHTQTVNTVSCCSPCIQDLFKRV